MRHQFRSDGEKVLFVLGLPQRSLAGKQKSPARRGRSEIPLGLE
ncbi:MULTISPECIES: hypothetical protein [Cyanophyceae]|nr:MULTISPECIES: hypothetical protein [Cyanophyceae]